MQLKLETNLPVIFLTLLVIAIVVIGFLELKKITERIKHLEYNLKQINKPDEVVDIEDKKNPLPIQETLISENSEKIKVWQDNNEIDKINNWEDNNEKDNIIDSINKYRYNNEMNDEIDDEINDEIDDNDPENKVENGFIGKFSIHNYMMYNETDTPEENTSYIQDDEDDEVDEEDDENDEDDKDSFEIDKNSNQNSEDNVENDIENIEIQGSHDDENFKEKIIVDESYSVNELKNICKKLGLQHSGNKTTLINRIMDNQ